MAQHKNLEHKSLYDDERIDQLGTVVKKLRISLGLTQADVA